jgi:hypothetical protein
MCQRLRRERVSLAKITGVDEPESRARVRSLARAMVRDGGEPVVFLMRQGRWAELTLIHGVDKVAAAQLARRGKINAVVFEPADIREENQVGAWGYGISEAGIDVWRGLRLLLKHTDPAEAEGAPRESCSVTLLPSMRAADAARMAAMVEAAGIVAGAAPAAPGEAR